MSGLSTVTVSPGLRQDSARCVVHWLPPGYTGSLKWARTFLHPQKPPSGGCDTVNSLKLGCRCQAGAQPWTRLEAAPALPGPCTQPLLRNRRVSCEGHRAQLLPWGTRLLREAAARPVSEHRRHQPRAAPSPAWLGPCGPR